MRPSRPLVSSSGVEKRWFRGRTCGPKQKKQSIRLAEERGAPVLDYFLTEEQQVIRDLAREIAEKELRPVSAEYDRSGDFPWPVVKVMASADLYRVMVDEAYGGLANGTPTLNMSLVTEELSRACRGIALAFALH